MKEITIASKNPAKIDQIKGALLGLVEVCGVSNDIILPEVVEDGKTAQENSRKKATTYAKFLKKPVISLDIALYFDDLKNDPRQPGLNVRRFKEGGRPTDTEMLEYYSELVKSLGGRVKAHWEFAVCVATSEGKVFETTIPSLRIFVEKPSSKVVEGFPLESLQIDPETNRYISEMSAAEQGEFWKRKIGKPLYNFISSVEL